MYVSVVERTYADKDLLQDVNTFISRRDRRIQEAEAMRDQFAAKVTCFSDISEETLAQWMMEAHDAFTVRRP